MENNRKMIFLVDDNITNLTAGSEALEDFYDVMTFNSGARLFKALERTIPDLILLDVSMPEMDGYEVIKLLKENPETESVPVIFLTGRDDEESEIEGLSLGSIDYITKPFKPYLLQKRIEVHLLVENQKQELQHFNNNLEDLITAKTKTIEEMKNTVLKTLGELVEYRDDINGQHIDRIRYYLAVIIDRLIKQGMYKDEIIHWDLDLVLHSAQLHEALKNSRS
jgi:putative two-component system response regulator